MKATMNCRLLHLVVLFVLIGVLLGCGGDGTPTPEPDLGPNLLIETGGSVSLNRAGWKDYAPVSFGVVVHKGDLIRPDEGQEARVLCADLTLLTVKREKGCACNVAEPVLLYDTTSLRAPRNPSAGQIPYILYPRNTTILEDRPLLRWNDTGASSYAVAVFHGGKALWEQPGVQGSEMRYPDDAPALDPGVDYLLMVTDEDTGHHSGEDTAKGLGFRILDPENKGMVEVRRDEILALPVEEPARRFALAVYYTGQRLRGDAKMLLDEVSADLDAPAVYLWQGDLLAAMQLPDEAEAAYETALIIAQTMGDLEAQAAAQVGLWQVTRDQAWLDVSIQGYEALGDQEQADALREESSQ